VSTYEALLRKIRCGAGVTSSSKEIYTAKCAVCHGERGDGKGPAGLALPLQPPDLGDRDMIAQMRDNYWFRRVSEGGLVEPFSSRGSAMPRFKGDVSVAESWAVIAYQHTFSGHQGPHVPWEHPEMVAMGRDIFTIRARSVSRTVPPPGMSAAL